MDAVSGGGQRPGRILHGGGTEVWYLASRESGTNWRRGTAWGAILSSHGRGWMQAVTDLESDRVELVHPALAWPGDVTPYDGLGPAESSRFLAFDRAEAAGRDSAMLEARQVRPGDRIRVARGGDGPDAGGPLELTVAGTAATSWDGTARIPVTGPDGDDQVEVPDMAQVEALLPPRHPAEDGPHAARMFSALPHAAAPEAPAPAGREAQLAGGLRWDDDDDWAAEPGAPDGDDGLGALAPGAGAVFLAVGRRHAVRPVRGGTARAGRLAGGAARAVAWPAAARDAIGPVRRQHRRPAPSRP